MERDQPRHPRGPAVTVVVPTMNQAGLLQRGLEALAAQTDLDFAAVVVNDGSADDTASRVAGLALPFPVTLVSVSNGGPARARNLGILVADEGAAEPAESRWVAFLDDDVVADPGWMAALKEAARGGAEILVGKTSATALAVPSAFSHQLTVLAAPSGPFPTCNLAVRRDVIARFGGFDRRFPYPAYEDTDWAMRVRAAGVKPHFAGQMRVDHPPRPSTLGGHLRRVRYQAAAVRLARKHRRLGVMVGWTDLLQYAGLVGTLHWLDQPWMWPFLAAWALSVYVRATSFLMMRAYTRRESLVALVLPVVTPWWKLLVYARALTLPWVWAPPDTALGPLPEGARISRLPPRASGRPSEGAGALPSPATDATPRRAPAPATR